MARLNFEFREQSGWYEVSRGPCSHVCWLYKTPQGWVADFSDGSKNANAMDLREISEFLIKLEWNDKNKESKES